MADEWDKDTKTPWTPPEEVELLGLPGPFDHLKGDVSERIIAQIKRHEEYLDGKISYEDLHALPGGVAWPRKKPTPIHLAPLVPSAQGAVPAEFMTETTDKIEDFAARARALDQGTEDAIVEAHIRARCMGAMVEAIAERSGMAEAQAVLNSALKKMGL